MKFTIKDWEDLYIEIENLQNTSIPAASLKIVDELNDDAFEFHISIEQLKKLGKFLIKFANTKQHSTQ